MPFSIPTGSLAASVAGRLAKGLWRGGVAAQPRGL